MPFARTDVLDISYELAGPADRPPVMLIHGWPDSARGWRPVAAGLNRLGWRTLVPELRGSGETRFRSPSTPRDGQGVALARDALDLADALGIERFAVVGHDWGARAAYLLSALAPERITTVCALALAYQPRGAFTVPDFAQARAFWYQWLMHVDAGAEAVRDDPVGFARIQWDTWSPPGWFSDDEFVATAAAFRNPDWAAVTLNAYRSRFLPGEPRDPRYDALREGIAATDRLSTPTLMVQGGSDYCDYPEHSDGLADHFTGGYRREVLDGVGHFPHREATDAVVELAHGQLSAHHRV